MTKFVHYFLHGMTFFGRFLRSMWIHLSSTGLDYRLSRFEPAHAVGFSSTEEPLKVRLKDLIGI